MEHAAGGMWDEWYAAFDDGRWGWIAEAQGRFYLTFETPADGLPSSTQIEVGGTLGDLVVSEVGSATVVGAEGEIPWRVLPGSSHDYADLSGPSGRFGSIDFSDDKPVLFIGSQTTLEDLGIVVDPVLTSPGAGVTQMAKSRVSVEKLSCVNCGGPLTLVAPDRSERVICPNCGGIHDVSLGNLQFLKALKIHGPKPEIPLGAKGTIDGVEYVVAGFMRRSVTFDQKYEWSEYLLFEREQGFRWLVESDHHWSFVWPIAAGDVVDGTRGTGGVAKTLVVDGKTFKIFQVAMAKVENVIGEFYWKVAVGETVRTFDYVAPPLAVSKEISSSVSESPETGGRKKKSTEVNYSMSRYLPADEVEMAFQLSGLRRPTSVGMQQPFKGDDIFPVWLKLMGALIFISLVVGLRGPYTDVFSEWIDFSASSEPWASGGIAATPSTTSTTVTSSADWSSTSTSTTTSTASDAAPKPENSRVIFTKPFTLSGGRNLRIEGSSEVENSWMSVSGDLVSEQTGLVEPFELPIEYYHGVDGGESWSEGSKSVSTVLSSLPAGSYVMRLEGQWPKNTSPRNVRIRADEGAFLWSHFFLAFWAVTIPALFAGYRGVAFEHARWGEASYTTMGTERE